MRAEDRARVETARFAWEEGLRSLQEGGRAPREVRLRLVEATTHELRRRVGTTFTLFQLAAEWEDSSSWYLPLAQRVAPKHPSAWDPSVALDAAFGRYARAATDARDRP